MPSGARQAAAVAVAAALSFLVAPAALSYDPTAWLLWGRELTEGTLDLTAGPAVKPLPVLLDGAVVGVAGDRAGELVWGWLARCGLLAAALLAWQLVRRGAPAARWPWAVAGGLVPLATLALVGPGMIGAAEPWTTALLLAAALARSDGRRGLALTALGGGALLRPEAVALLIAVAIADAWPTPDPPRRPRRVVARRRGHAATVRSPRPKPQLPAPLSDAGVPAAAVIVVVAASYAALQLLGTGSLRGAADRATALREGQPGLADVPLVATLREAAAAMPWLAVGVPLMLLGWAAWRQRRTTRAPAPAGAPRQPATPRAASVELLAGGAIWTATVAVMAAAGFSGEARYLAPGLVLLATGAIILAARTEPQPRAAAVLAVAAAGAAAIWTLADAGTHARTLARSHAELHRVLADPAVQARLPSCTVVAVPRFARPAVAWQLNRPISSLRSPDLAGAGCTLQRPPAPGDGSRGPRSDPGADGGRLTRLAADGRWSFWATPR